MLFYGIEPFVRGSFALFQRLFLVVATLFCTLLIAACDRVEPHREPPAPVAKVSKAAVKSAHEKKPRSAWNQLRASLRHAEESSRSVMIDEDDDDGDEPDLTTVSIWDDVKDDGSTSDAAARAPSAKAHGPDKGPEDVLFVGAIRKARGHDGGMERPPRG